MRLSSYRYIKFIYWLQHLSTFLPAEAGSSRMFEGFPNELMKALTQEPLTGNFHHYGVTVQVQWILLVASVTVKCVSLPPRRSETIIWSFQHQVSRGFCYTGLKLLTQQDVNETNNADINMNNLQVRHSLSITSPATHIVLEFFSINCMDNKGWITSPINKLYWSHARETQCVTSVTATKESTRTIKT